MKYARYLCLTSLDAMVKWANVMSSQPALVVNRGTVRRMRQVGCGFGGEGFGDELEAIIGTVLCKIVLYIWQRMIMGRMEGE